MCNVNNTTGIILCWEERLQIKKKKKIDWNQPKDAITQHAI